MISNIAFRSFYTVLFLFLTSLAAYAQAPPQKDEVIRINTELVQTAVTVTDKQGKFVDGLQPEQFSLTVDGKPYPIRFLERVIAGSSRELQLTGITNPAASPALSKVTQRGRTIIFFVDDLHLSLDSLNRTRGTLLNFIDNEMSSRDYVAVTSASGQVGFLQQFTNNREVLKAAVHRLNYRPTLARGIGMGGAPMSEYMAFIIDSRSDPKVTDVYIQECMKQTSMPKKLRAAAEAIRMTCETQVKSNARSILLQSAAITEDTYNSLDSLLRSSARLPGRKLAFFISDGFLLDAGPRGRDLQTKLQTVTDAALRSGVVVYTIDAKGLVSTALDATNNRVMDPNGRLESVQLREIAATQDAMHALANDTGGRALRNQNYFDRWVGKALDETSNYYLLAWRPETDEQKERKFHHVEVAVNSRPDLSVKLPKGYFEGSKLAVTTRDPNPPAVDKPPITVAVKTSDVALGAALTDSFSGHSLPTLLSLSYLNTPANGFVVTTAMQIPSRVLDYGPEHKEATAVDLAGVILNDKGKVVTSFKKRLSLDPAAIDPARPDTSNVIYNHRAPLAPGIYQVRVAAREDRTSRVGSAMDWVVVPDLQNRQLALSSLLIGGQVLETAASKDDANHAAPQVQFSVDRRFAKSSNLEFWLFVYNASRDSKNAGKPNLTVQLQVLRDAQTIVSTTPHRLNTNGMPDLDRIPYGGNIALKSLSPGRYELRVTVNDVGAGTSSTVRSDFEVD